MHIKATAARSQLGLEAAQSHLVSEIICTKRSLLLKHTQHYSFPPCQACRSRQGRANLGGEPPALLWVQHQLHGVQAGAGAGHGGEGHPQLCVKAALLKGALELASTISRSNECLSKSLICYIK